MSAPLVSIPDCSAHHLLGEDNTFHLASNARLELVAVKGSSDTPALTLTLGESIAFPLDDQTVLGTQEGNGCIYLLRPHLVDVTGPQGWVKIELPGEVEDASTELGKLRDRFEEILVQHGFLYGSGIRAGGDEIAAGLKEGGQTAAESIQSSVDSYKANTQPADAPASFSRNTHARAARASSITGTAAGYATQAVSAIGGLSQAVGSGLARTFGVGERAEADKSEARKGLEATGNAARDIGSGLSQGTNTITTSASSGATDAISHSKGEETATLAGHGASTASNVGQVAGAGLVTTSMAFHGAGVAQGVAEVDLHPEQDRAKNLADELDNSSS